MTRRWAVGALVAVSLACGSEAPAPRDVAPTPRRMTIWLDGSGLQAATAEQLRAVGVDQVVSRRGSIDLRGRAPVLRIDAPEPVAGPIPLALALTLSGARTGLDRSDAEAVWRVLESELGTGVPSELILDLPELAEGLDGFLVALREVSGVAVVPLLSFEQLTTATGRNVAVAMGSCVVPAFGTDGTSLRGIGERGPLPLDDKLAALADTEVRVRIAVSLQARTEPAIAGVLEGLDALTEGGASVVSTSSVLDRSFTLQRPLEWSGRRWDVGETIAVRWMDAARLHAAMQESHRLLMPELGGWDLVTLPPEGHALGLTRDGLQRFLAGEGPGPEVEVSVRRDGRWLRVAVDNPSVFATAVSNHGTWVEVSLEDEWVKATEAGSFERLSRGTLRAGEWQQESFERVNAVRFFEVYLAPGESLLSGRVELPSTRSRPRIRWHLSLSDGTAVSGETTG